jgi:hypothetical protein
MHVVYEEFRNGGWPNLVIVFLGFWGLVLGLVAAGLAAGGAASARMVGAVSVALAGIILSTGALGVAQGRRVTDRAIEGASIEPLQKERIRREGYLESKSCAKFGIGCALLPLIGGAAAMLTARRRKDDRPGEGAPDGIGLTASLLGVAGLLLLANGAFVRAKLPGRDLDPMDPTWQLLEGAEDVDAGRVERGCKRIEDALTAVPYYGDRELEADPSKVPDFAGTAARCVDSRIDAALAKPEQDRRAALEDVLSKTNPKLLDEAHKARIAAEIGRQQKPEDPFAGGLGGLGTGKSGKLPKLSQGATTVSGRLPPEVIQRIVRQNFGRLRLCYENGLRKDPTLGGEVRVKFVIDRTGSVATSQAAADVPAERALKDPAVVACVVRAFQGLSFPEPEGGIVTVVYPVIFTAAP